MLRSLRLLFAFEPLEVLARGCECLVPLGQLFPGPCLFEAQLVLGCEEFFVERGDSLGVARALLLQEQLFLLVLGGGPGA